MSVNPLNALFTAHGGVLRWHQVSQLEVVFSVHGLLPTMKRVPRVRHVRARISTQRPEVTLFNYPSVGMQCRLLADERVQLCDASGKVVDQRNRPRVAFGMFRRQLWWDTLDFTYFCGYAMWNYLTTPFLFRQPGVEARVVTTALSAYPTQVAVRFPPDMPTHCERQNFWFDANNRLARHDYTADVVGSWATACHLSDRYHEFGGLWFPTRRRVHPLLPNGKPLTSVLLVGIDIHDVLPLA